MSSEEQSLPSGDWEIGQTWQSTRKLGHLIFNWKIVGGREKMIYEIADGRACQLG
jgi:hypothetical protein